MSPQLTLQTPLRLPPEEILSYLDQLWSSEISVKAGANTFSLLVWDPSWIEQHLVRTGKLAGPITGTQSEKLIEAARKVVLEDDLPHSTSPFDSCVKNALALKEGSELLEDLRGEHVHSAISALQPRRLITLAPTLDEKSALETLVAAYCPLPEEGDGSAACGDVVVLRGDSQSISDGLGILQNLLLEELPSWVWWKGCMDEATKLFEQLALSQRRLIVDSSLGNPIKCLELLQARVETGQAVNDLNWLRLRNWRETLAMVFDPPDRREALTNIVQLDIDVEGHNPVQGLLLAAWISDRLGWKLKSSCEIEAEGFRAEFDRPDGRQVQLSLVPLPVGKPSIHPGQLVGIRLICEPNIHFEKGLCVILGAETGECMRLEAGGMASMDLLEDVVPLQSISVEEDVARLLSSSRGSTSPLLASAAPMAAKLLTLSKASA